MKTPFTPFLIVVLFLLFGHISASAQHAAKRDTFLIDPSHPVLPPARQNPEDRAKIKKEAVAVFRDSAGIGRKNMKMVVKLYETSKTMHYRIDVDYNGLPGSDTVRLPDLGTVPRPALRKGSTDLSCIVGFLDNDNQFREVKLVYVTPGFSELKIHTLRHWHVSTHYRLVANL